MRLRYRVARDPAVDLQEGLAIVPGQHLARSRDLLRHGRNVLLRGESGVDGHDQNEIDVPDHLFRVRQRSTGVEREAGLHAAGPDLRELPLHVRGGLRMKGEQRRPRLGERRDVPLGPFDHQMDVQRQVGDSPQCRHQTGAESEVRHEVPIHHVDVDPVGSALLDQRHLVGELGEVGAQYARRNPDVARHMLLNGPP